MPSAVEGSARRIDFRPYVGRYRFVCALALAVSLATFLASGERRAEHPLESAVREAQAAPLEVFVALLALMAAGATKRLFGYGAIGLAGHGTLAVLLAVAAACHALFEGAFYVALACATLVPLAVGSLRPAWAPWILHGALSTWAIMLARAGMPTFADTWSTDFMVLSAGFSSL